MKKSEILVEVRRGGTIESLHRGHLIAVDGDGKTVCSLGEPETVTFLRSSAKPFQAIAFLLSGAAEKFEFSEAEIALACASHSGEAIHTATAARMLEKIGCNERDLRCGVHEPFNSEVARRLIENREQPTQLHNNCSGKHAAMLAFAKHSGAPLENYDALEHPIQQRILQTIEKFSGLPREQIAVGVDGCSAPNFAVSIKTMATMYARLVCPLDWFDDDLRAACRRVVSAFVNYPEMIGGRATERLDTLVMQAAGGRIVSKIGAEGVYTAGVLPDERWRRGLGVALKIEDGSERRARPVAALETLRQLGVLNWEEHDRLKPFARIRLENHRGAQIGEAAPNFVLNFPG